ncbi:Secretory lipase family protein [Ophiocordyceps camponoti-floridani]|uniref:Secretory lipase family protein n=1 Tax=Ophiocordyceps camponoti-floridani TaxID=2030778 RepID=A0A8H4Q279_9HYPO|nr:Secretory lipase family protein [Ophiocordyceps camponoti-floridani]
MVRLARLLGAVLLASPAISELSSGHDHEYVPLPSEDPFYKIPPEAETAQPGTILKHRFLPSGVSAFGIPFDKFFSYKQQILYRTTGQDGNAIATVLTVLVPQKPDYTKVVSLQVAEDTASIDCAPSFGILAASADHPRLDAPTVKVHLLLAQAAFSRGWIIVIPDTAGPNAVFPAGKSAAYAVLDGVRAALGSTSFTNISNHADVALWGYSGGGSETLDAIRLQPTYAPELKFKGAAFGGVTPYKRDLNQAISVLNKGSSANLIPVALLGQTANRPDMRMALWLALKPEFRETFFQPLHQCHDANKALFNNQDIIAMFDYLPAFLTYAITHPLTSDSVDVNTAPPKNVPMYWYQLANDHLADKDAIIKLVRQWCADGARIDFNLETFGGYHHAGYGLVGAPAAVRWLAEVLEGKAGSKTPSSRTPIESKARYLTGSPAQRRYSTGQNSTGPSSTGLSSTGQKSPPLVMGGRCRSRKTSTPEVEQKYLEMFPKMLQESMKAFVDHV